VTSIDTQLSDIALSMHSYDLFRPCLWVLGLHAYELELVVYV
jgi:hypothetical protein